jgi:D-inositol-3-phosphate glycosyltransferase
MRMGAVSEPARVAFLSLHTSPLDPPGVGDSGGMNVYVRNLAWRIAEAGVEVDVYTRCAGRGVPQIEEIRSGFRVFQVPAGPCAELPKDRLPPLLPTFVRSVLELANPERPYDLVHAHYWLSGRAGRALSARWDVPLVVSFHTLGRVKNLAGELSPEPELRIAGEQAAVDAADRIIVPTLEEERHLVDLYRAGPERVLLIPPGVDAHRFSPADGEATKARLGLGGARVALFAGRLQPVKGPDLAISAVAEAVQLGGAVSERLTLLVVGGPSGPGGALEVGRLRELARSLGIAANVRFLPPVPHEEMADLYRAADVVVVPSRTESFGLAALEAQACGIPVVASDVGGLRTVVSDGRSGFLVSPGDVSMLARRVVEILGDDALRSRLSVAARARASLFPWEATAARTLAAYDEVVSAAEPAEQAAAR